MLASESYLSRMQDGNVVVTDQEDGGQERFSLGLSAEWGCLSEAQDRCEIYIFYVVVSRDCVLNACQSDLQSGSVTIVKLTICLYSGKHWQRLSKMRNVCEASTNTCAVLLPS